MDGPLLALLLAAATPQPQLALPARPATLRPVIEAVARCSANPQLVVAVTAFTPPRRGSASLVVSLRTADGRRQRLGEVTIYPHQAFSTSLAQAERFGFAVPKGALARNPVVLVELSSDGDGAGAQARIGEARIAPPPQERCRRSPR